MRIQARRTPAWQTADGTPGRPGGDRTPSVCRTGSSPGQSEKKHAPPANPPFEDRDPETASACRTGSSSRGPDRGAAPPVNPSIEDRENENAFIYQTGGFRQGLGRESEQTANPPMGNRKAENTFANRTGSSSRGPDRTDCAAPESANGEQRGQGSLLGVGSGACSAGGQKKTSFRSELVFCLYNRRGLSGGAGRRATGNPDFYMLSRAGSGGTERLPYAGGAFAAGPGIKKARRIRKFCGISGGPDRDRTGDLTDANRTLSQGGKFFAHGLRCMVCKKRIML